MESEKAIFLLKNNTHSDFQNLGVLDLEVRPIFVDDKYLDEESRNMCANRKMTHQLANTIFKFKKLTNYITSTSRNDNAISDPKSSEPIKTYDV